MAQTPLRPMGNLGARNKKELVWRKNKGDGTVCDWSLVDTDVIRYAIDSCTKAGGAIMFGVTSDGGAYSVCILQGDHKIKEYPHTAQECVETLKQIADWYLDFKL